jgi:transcriptional regulator with XRE-family HTH domain
MPQPKKGKSLGKRMQEIRTAKGFSIEFLSNETGFSADYISSVEKGEVVPPVATLLRLSRALEIDSGILLKEEMRATDKKKAEDFRKRTEDYSYQTLTPEAVHKHLKAFKVFIDPIADHKGVSYQHEGEEFIYVLKGTIEVTVGENKTILSPESSIHFNSSIVHKLRNVSQEKAELIVALYTP